MQAFASSSGPNASTAPPSTGLDLPALQDASRVLHDHLVKDMQAIPDVGELLTMPGIPSSASYSFYTDDYRVPFKKRRLVRIPDGLFQFYNTTMVTSHMGLMPEIERAWISIDHKLFLWDYTEGQEMCSYVEQPNTISHVALVKPKPGIFIDEIAHLLVLCTPTSVFVLGLSATARSPAHNRSQYDIKLFETDLNISTDIEMTSVVGTPTGRIFMCGMQDGSLYELHYQEKESWFGKRIQLINHSSGSVPSFIPTFSSPKSDERLYMLVSDLARNCFYTLNSRNAISMYSFVGDKTVQKIQTLDNLSKLAHEKAQGSPALNPSNFSILSIHAVSSEDSRGVQLLAVTTSGVRLYFAPTSNLGYAYSYTTTSSSGLRLLQLVHVRLPPANLVHPDEHSGPQRSGASGYNTGPSSSESPRSVVVHNLENCAHAGGLTITSQPGDTEGDDFLLCIAPDLTKMGTTASHLSGQPAYSTSTYRTPYGIPGTSQRPVLTEHAALLSISGRTWAVAALTDRTAASHAPPSMMNELATQFSESPRQFLVLTNTGITFLVKRRALDYLIAAVEDVVRNGHKQPIIDFRDSFGRDQTCAMLLGLASGNSFCDPDSHGPRGELVTMNAQIMEVAKNALVELGERPVKIERNGDGTGEASFSGRREGLALYFAKLIRPIWKAKLTKPSPNGRDLGFSERDLTVIQRNLFTLRRFLEQNPQIFHAIPSEYDATRRSNAPDQDTWKIEIQSLAHLQSLLARTVEAISFLLLLKDYKFSDIMNQSEASTQKLLSSLTVEELITTLEGVTLSRGLVNTLINQQIGQQMSVDTISEVLQARCGTFCSTDDVMLYKAKECVRKAAESKSPTEIHELLGESLRLFVKGSRILDLDKLREICGDYQHLNYATGAIELPLHCANVVDPDNLGKALWIAHSPPSGAGNIFFERRMQCYELGLDSLKVFEDKSSTVEGPLAESFESARRHAYELAFSSEDEIFHSTLYAWLIGRGLAGDLLEIRPMFLEAHLKRPPVTLQNSQLLWQFYVKEQEYLRAAEVLAALAESQEFNVSLENRYEYLSLAVSNAKSHPITQGTRHESAIAFLTDLEEKLEVAQVQVETYGTVFREHRQDAASASKLRDLSSRLHTITELYQDYAIPYDLLEIQLLIFHVSEHRDDAVANNIWTRLLNTAVEGAQTEAEAADRVQTMMTPLGQRFYPSDSAFPLRHIASLLVQFQLSNMQGVSIGWASRILVQCRVPYAEVWDALHEMYESQVPPFNEQENVQLISGEIAVLLTDWFDDARRPRPLTALAKEEFLADRIVHQIDQYISELAPSSTETRTVYTHLKQRIMQHF